MGPSCWPPPSSAAQPSAFAVEYHLTSSLTTTQALNKGFLRMDVDQKMIILVFQLDLNIIARLRSECGAAVHTSLLLH